MSNNISLNEVKMVPFLASENSKTEILKNGIITNLDTNSSFEVINQIESANGFSATVFRNIPQRG
ncbi:hypothetical protein PTQ33_07685 [Campylobacter sp. 50012-21]|uniref:hypothetical protein n=1 Tax=Campylobacter magnus TaxID=3026462 RepID=UPI00235DD289|nr:hypothetical protein [Campylobacter magnus]MDD0847009.1 hypothetical protein [Campylobacter magnus]